MTKQLFLSYRRDDRAGSAGRIYDILSEKLANVNVFMDVIDFEPGIDFVRALEEQLSACEYLVVVIGPEWVNSKTPDGRRRLDDPNDYVRLEIETALRRGIRVVPLLVDGASMPRMHELPESLHQLAVRNAFEVSHSRFQTDVSKLADSISRHLGLQDGNAPDVLNQHSRPGWGDTLLSFSGRLSRREFWFWNLVVVLPATVLIEHFLLAALGSSYWEYYASEKTTIQHEVT